jgi:hypothetical protein
VSPFRIPELADRAALFTPARRHIGQGNHPIRTPLQTAETTEVFPILSPHMGPAMFGWARDVAREATVEEECV